MEAYGDSHKENTYLSHIPHPQILQDVGTTNEMPHYIPGK